MTVSDTYTRQLILALQARNVPADRIGEVVAEVDSHVAVTGEDPREAFGTPAEYARMVAPDGTPGVFDRRHLGGLLLAWVLGGATGWLTGTTVFRLASGSDRVYGLPAWSAVALCAVLVAATAVAAGRQRRAVRDPRDHRRLSPSGSLAFLAVIVVAVVAIAALGALTA